MARLSLRARLVLGVFALAAAGLVAADAATYTSLRSFLLDRVDRTLEAGHGQVEQLAFGPAGKGDRGGPNPGRGGGPSGGGISWYAVTTLSGTPVKSGFLGLAGGSPPKLPSQIHVPTRPDPQDPLHEPVSYLTVPSRDGSTSYRVRISLDPQSGAQLVVVATSLQDVFGTLHRLLLIELLVTAAALTGIAGLGFWVVRLGLRPLRGIEQTAIAITAGDLSHRVGHPDARTEVGRVGSALNAMLDRIEASDRRLRRFVSDASHELRTPLAAVRAYAELFARGAAARPEDLERSMSGIAREARRMSRLVDDLLLLARLDEGRPGKEEPVDLAELAGEAVDAARVVEPDRPIDIAVESATVAGDRDRLRQVLDNLLANARAHTPPGTPVSVELRRVDGAALLSVADHGAGLTEEQASRVFERFYRVDSSRTRASGGAGLGLSIVAAITEAHGGTAAVLPTPGGGATFVVTLPLAA
jgi:two-component system, OmpR family, sensor kinase